MLTESLLLLADQLLFMTAEEAQVFLDKNYPDYEIEVHADSSATVSGPDGVVLQIANGGEPTVNGDA